MLLGAATQMGAQLLYDSQTVDFDQNETPTKITPEEITNFEPVKMPEEEAKEKEPATVTETKAEKTEPKGNLDYVDKDQSLEYFGFVESGDVAKKAPPPVVNAEEKKVPDVAVKEEFQEIPEEEKIEEEKKNGLVENVLMMIPQAKIFVSKIMHSLLKASGSKPKMLLLMIIAAVILILAVLFLLTLNTKATVTILVNPKTDQKTAAVTFSPNAATDISSDTLASQPLSVSEDGSMTTNATGTKDIGASAKGSVTIFNIGTGELDLPSGTQITSPNNLVFTLDSAVTVASGDAILGASTGSVNVTASDIGQDYNLPSGTKFTVSGQDSSVAAKNDNAFSGGSKKTVTVVSNDDVQKLLTGLPKQLEAKAKTDIGPKVTGDNVLLKNFVSENVDQSSDSFDHKAGDQANSVTLKGTVDFQALTYNSNDMLKLAQSLFGSSDTQVSQNNLSVTANNIGLNKDNSVSADLQISAGLVPKLDSATTAKQIAGVSITKARNLLMNISQVQNVGITLNPSLPFLSQNLPGNPNDITIQITAK